MGTPEWSRRVRVPPRGLTHILKIMEKFIKFLEDNNAWENFERNFIEQGRDGKRYRRDCKTYDGVHLANAFTWSETKEGSKYWSRLNAKWLKENQSLKDELLSNV